MRDSILHPDLDPVILAMCAERSRFMNPIGGDAVVADVPSKARAGAVAGIDKTGGEQTRTVEDQVDVAIGHVVHVDVIAEAAMAVGPAGLMGGITRLQLA